MKSCHPPGTEHQIRVLLADRQTIVRQGLKALLDREEGIEVIADTGDGQALFELAREHLPDVIVTEISLPRLNGIDAARRIAAERLPCQVLFLTGNCDRDSVANAFDAGARGYILKETDFKYLLEGICAVHALETYLGPKVSEILVRNFVQTVPNQPAAMAPLTVREQEILRLTAEGNNSKDIAFILGISNKTVDTFRRQCMKKLKLKSVADMTRYALREGMVRL